MSTVLTGGFDHYDFRVDGAFVPRGVTSTGPIQSDPAVPATVNRFTNTNAGYFGQAVLNLHEAVFVTAGVRADQNSSFGSDVSTRLSPRVGVSIVQDIGPTTVKLRGAWGDALRPPLPGLSNGFVSASSIILANASLGPERQRGWDGGVDVGFGSRASLGVTYYNQAVHDLVELVLIDATSSPPTFQYQNTSRVKNTGVEIEGTLCLPGVDLQAQYTILRSRVRELPPAYAGELMIGDQLLSVPTETASIRRP